MASISVRALGPNYEPAFGRGQADFLTDLDAVAQIIGTKLRLLQGEWWEDLSRGLPLFQSILNAGFGEKGVSAASLAIQQVILSVPFVTGVSNVSAAYTGANRKFTFSCSVSTQFGTLQITNQPGLTAAVT